MGTAPEGSIWVAIADRGGDIFAALRTARRLGHHFLIRAAQNRKVLIGPPGQQAAGYLRTRARQLPPQAHGGVAVASKGGRPAREAAVALAAEALWLQPAGPESKRRDAEPLLVGVERIGLRQLFRGRLRPGRKPRAATACGVG